MQYLNNASDLEKFIMDNNISVYSHDKCLENKSKCIIFNKNNLKNVEVKNTDSAIMIFFK